MHSPFRCLLRIAVLAMNTHGAWVSLSLLANTAGKDEQPTGIAFLESVEQGVWAIARDKDPTTQETVEQLILSSVLDQVTSGEDLTAAFLVAHGRACRDSQASQGAEIIALRLSRGGTSFELAWVGALQAFLVRGSEALPLTKPTEPADREAGGRANALLITTTRVAALGCDAKVRPKIDRKLSHAQRGDILVLTGEELDAQTVATALTQSLKGFWSLEYKARKLQGLLESKLAKDDRTMPLLLCRVK